MIHKSDETIEMKDLPTWLQELWEQNPSLARRAEKHYIELIEQCNIADVNVSLQEIEKIKRIAWLKGVTEYTIWADYVPNGDDICDKYQEELERLLRNEA